MTLYCLPCFYTNDAIPHQFLNNIRNCLFKHKLQIFKEIIFLKSFNSVFIMLNIMTDLIVSNHDNNDPLTVHGTYMYINPMTVLPAAVSSLSVGTRI